MVSGDGLGASWFEECLQGNVFNTNMIDLFYESKENDVANYADHTTRYSCGTDIPTIISELQVRF